MKVSTLLINVLVAALLFGAGVATGWWAASQPASPEATPAPVAAAPVLAQPTTPEANTLWLTVEFDGGSSLVPAARVEGLLLASLMSVYPTNAVYFVDNNGERQFPKVVAFDAQSQLVALSDPRLAAGNEPTGFRLSADTGSLYIGRDVTLELPDRQLPGQIESALQIAENGREYYQVTFDSSVSRRGGALAQGDELIGFVVTSRHATLPWMHVSGDLYSAIDAASLRAFLQNDRQAPQSPRDFTSRFAQSPGGLRHEIGLLATRQQWGEVYARLQRLSSGGNLTATERQALTLSAYYYGHQLAAAGEGSAALTLVQSMQNQYPDAQPWCVLRLQAHVVEQDWPSVVEQATACLNRPTGTRPHDTPRLATSMRDTLRSLDSREAIIRAAHQAAMTFASDTRMSPAAQSDVLLAALDLAEQASLYRRLGDIEYESGRYAAAQSYYNAAIRLDPSIAATLGNRLRNSTQRADSAPASEVPFVPSGGGIVVTAQLNNSPQSFRFLVDTGATYTALSRGTLLRLGLGHRLNDASDIVQLESANGTLYAQRMHLNSIQLGSASVSDVPVVILENFEGFDGLLGLSFLRHFDVSIDQDSNRLILVQR
ncbi:MAG: TIGR02281 family clan AA aspartic protease [Pseudomonadota bacterium]